MTQLSEFQTPKARRRWPVDLWSIGAVAIAALVLMPIIAVLWMALNPAQNIWPHLIATTLPRYLSNTAILMFSVGALSAVVGTGAAWLISMYRFPMSRTLNWALLLPLAIPGYVGAYALVDFLEYAGPVQTALREVFGWSTSRDYYFPQIRSRWAAVVVLSASLFPYVYLLSRAAFREQRGGVYEVARALGAGPWGRFFRVGLPLARPAIAVGVAVVMMETVNDFGTVDFFAVQTLTTGIFTVWLEQSNAGGAAQIASVILIVILGLALIERLGRRRLRFYQHARNSRPVEPVTLAGFSAWGAALFCLVPFLVGFILPVTVMGAHALTRADRWLEPGLAGALFNTVSVGLMAAVVTVGAAVFLVYGVRLTGRLVPRLLLPLTTVGYAAPGAVLAVGILIPLAAFDNAFADWVLRLTGVEIGLLLTGSVGALIYAYAVRFFAIGQGAVDAAMGRVSPSLPMAARSLGKGPMGVLRQVYAPMMKSSVATGLLLVFVDCVKELPATLILRPFNFNSLATRTYEQASLERIADAAPSALLIIAVGLAAVLLLVKSSR